MSVRILRGRTTDLPVFGSLEMAQRLLARRGMRSPWPLILVLASAVLMIGCGSTSGSNSGTGGTTGASGGAGGGARGGTSGTGGTGTGSGGTGGTAGGHAGGSTGGGGHGGSGSGGLGGQTGAGGSGGACAACAGADRASLCPTDVATASMCPSQGATCCEASDFQWQCGNCVAETCHWIRSCIQTGTGGNSGSGGSGGAAGGSSGGAGAGGGHGGGAGGQGGQTTDGGPSCTQLMTEYSAAVTAALVCRPGAQNQCAQQALLPNCTTCYETVNDATTLTTLRTQLIAQGCVHPTACPCAAPQTSGCVANDAGSAAGTCMPTTN
jgi:hypothetical protein